MFRTMASTISISAEAEGALVSKRALEGERARVCEGRQDELPTSRLRGDDPTLSYCFDVLIF
jgi:hypothetical protein